MKPHNRVIPVGKEPPQWIRPGESGGQESVRTVKSKSKNRHRDRFAVLNEFVDCTMGQLIRSEVTVWLVLYRDTRDGAACSSYSDISARAGVSRRTVATAIGKLVRLGLIRVIRRGGLNKGPSIYRVKGIV